MRPEVLEEVLTQEHREAGLYLEKPDDELVYLKRGNQVLATWLQIGAPVECIRDEADKHI